jgi:uncharacterized protein YndB with AHSA1/START domain
MNKKFTARASITIDVPPSRVWQALTSPEMIKEYLFGTAVSSDWQVGSPITYRGEWEGQDYEDRGKILEVEPEKLFVSTFWSSLSGQEDSPENYQTVRYELAPAGAGTRLTITQDNNESREDAHRSEENWKTVLEGMKRLLEDEKQGARP